MRFNNGAFPHRRRQTGIRDQSSYPPKLAYGRRMKTPKQCNFMYTFMYMYTSQLDALESCPEHLRPRLLHLRRAAAHVVEDLEHALDVLFRLHEQRVRSVVRVRAGWSWGEERGVRCAASERVGDGRRLRCCGRDGGEEVGHCELWLVRITIPQSRHEEETQGRSWEWNSQLLRTPGAETPTTPTRLR